MGIRGVLFNGFGDAWWMPSAGTIASDGHSNEPADSGPSLSRSEIFDILRNQRRRAVIKFLLENGGMAHVKEVTEAVAAAEFGKSADRLTSTEYKRVYTGLYQWHLERMEKLGVISVDKGKQTISLRDDARQFAPYLPIKTGYNWIRIELAIVMLVTAVITLWALGLEALQAVPEMTWGHLTVLILLGVAFLHNLDTTPA